MDISMDAATATEHLFEQYKHEVYRYARYALGSSSEAEDVVQEVFIKVLRNWERFRGDSSPKTWLWTIVRSCIADRGRKRKRQRVEVEMNDNLDGYGSYHDTGTLEMEDSLRRLPQAHREVIVLRILQDWSVADTAQILDWSESKVKTTLHRAVTTLRKQMEDEEGRGSVHGLREH
ncbi:RNA polymerase sigma factor [Alicyclobacillus mengziensis]|uniref:RNA polymerase sigma factor n=1 Tax=Alicyclobacillus mengziensis TaxID=2931921 RepID=A0A9X7Z8I3_9BACL|nr:RNA polymerase sigma factor [Alicyclobacillus mengziensis]QSO48440.1 RNA polymerase sigma factor [Alicyclobacillus mengziensis]